MDLSIKQQCRRLCRYAAVIVLTGGIAIATLSPAVYADAPVSSCSADVTPLDLSSDSIGDQVFINVTLTVDNPINYWKVTQPASDVSLGSWSADVDGPGITTGNDTYTYMDDGTYTSATDPVLLSPHGSLFLQSDINGAPLVFQVSSDNGTTLVDCTVSPFIYTVAAPDDTGITVRDVNLISLFLASFVGWLTIKQFRWRHHE